jgi:hypothetical protein
MKRILAFYLYLMCLSLPSAQATSTADIEKMTTYATLIGRALACGVDVNYAVERVGEWMDKVFPPGSTTQRACLSLFVKTVRYHAKQQARGNSPAFCGWVERKFSETKWP